MPTSQATEGEPNTAPQLPTDVLGETVLAAYDAARQKGLDEDEALQELFPNTLLDAQVLKQVASALVSGSNVLLLGPPGSGKTSLAKDIWDLFPKQTVVVDGCPVQDHPASVTDPAWSRQVPPCPYCQARFGDGVAAFDAAEVDAADVPAKAVFLREGYGLARVQGSPEVFPDNLTGAINIAKLEEVGDPNSPLVMEPGKVLQANRGVLMIDEIGKLPRGTQNVLLQALQERIVTPAKSRETFPASFVAIATSNLQDLDNVTEPLVGRLAIVYVPFNDDHEKNVEIVRRGNRTGHGWTPRLFADASSGLIENWRRTAASTDELSEVGSNRTMIDILRRARALARLGARDELTAEDYRQGAHDAMLGRIRARGAETFHQNQQVVRSFLEKRLEDSLTDAAYRYWCTYYQRHLGEDKAEGLRTLDALRASADGREGDASKVQKFQEFVAGFEDLDGVAPDEAGQRVFRLLDEHKAFEEREEAA